MSNSYKIKVDSTKAALFGTSTPGSEPSMQSNRPVATTSKASISKPTVTSVQPVGGATAASKWTGKLDLKNSLSPEQKVAKMNEAEDYRKRAKKLMTPGFFSSADPIAATTYYKKAADLYKACDEPKLEMLLRISAAELNDERLAASEYYRAAELAARIEGYGVEKSSYYFQCSSQLYLEIGDRSKAAECICRAGAIFIDPITKSPKTGYENKCLKHLEQSVNMFVPLVLNPRQKYSCTLESSGNLDERSARELVVSSPNAGKILSNVMIQLIEMGEINSALYAAGAVSYLFKHDGVSTISLNRSYLTETILVLAMGDSVAANEMMLEHFQSTPYLSSRECELEENLVRAILSCDEEALLNCKQAPVLNNIDRIVVELLHRVRVIGSVKKQPRSEDIHDVDVSKENDDAVFQEMEEIMDDMGLNDDDDEFDLT